MQYWELNLNSIPNKITQCTYKRNIEARSCNHCCHGKAVSITNFERVFCSPRYPARNSLAPYFQLRPAQLYYIFAHYLINSKIFEKNKSLNIKCVF